MSVNINWNSLEQESLLAWSKRLLNDALNSGKRPSILASNIEIEDLNFGNNAPIVEILEIGDLDNDKFRGIFKIKYTGDSYIDLSTKIQANPMNVFYKNSVNNYMSDFILPDLSNINQNFNIPIHLKLSNIILSGIIIIVFNKSKGLTLVFKNDPLENIEVSSTFDGIPVIRNFLQIQIENQIRDLFREILPNVLYKVSQRWTNNIHSQLLNGNNKEIKNHDDNNQVIMFSDINPDGPDLSPGNLLRLATLGGSRQTLSLTVPIIKDFIQRSAVEKWINDHNNFNDNNVIFSFNNHKYSNGLPIDLFNVNSLDDYKSIDKVIIDVSKYQLINYNNKNQNKLKLVKKPKRRVIKLGKKSKKIEKEEIKSEISDDSTINNDSIEENHEDLSSNNSTIVEEEEFKDEDIIIKKDQKFKEKRALSSSSASVEFLKNFYKDKQNSIKKQTNDQLKLKIKQSIKESSKPPSTYILPQLNDNKESLRSPLNDKAMLSLSLGFKKNSSDMIKINLNKKRNSNYFDDPDYYKKVSSTNNFLNDFPPPYVP